MTNREIDILIVGAGPVGLMCAYLGTLCGLSVLAVDKSDGPLKVGRADALNARTLQFLEIVGLFDELYPLGKICNTSSVWANGNFISRQSSWWDELEGCFHKHFLMLGQSHIELILDEKLKSLDVPLLRSTRVNDIKISDSGCITSLSNGIKIKSKYLIGADGASSFVREHLKIPFDIIRPQIIWAVVDGIIETDFPKVPEIIVFQSETSDVAWIPREGDIDRFYVRMDRKDFSFVEVLEKINHAMKPHFLKFNEVVWFSQFSVKESLASKFFSHERVFLAGDSCHIHSVNGGQGLNTGLADAFNLIWKLNMVLNQKVSQSLLTTYESERKPVAQSVIESSAELVRATKYSEQGTHAQDYVKIVQKRAGNITGMGIRYVGDGLDGTRLFDFELYKANSKHRVYSLLSYNCYTLLVFSEVSINFNLSSFIKLITIKSKKDDHHFWSESSPYKNQIILVRPDSYIEFIKPTVQLEKCLEQILQPWATSMSDSR
jgi:2-polyprenyl-6-methoxyphenol hydroxylase-like FAD-dependent oxidoreductase